ncbi:MAG: UDP-N-acetylglucosamine diphosphorylase [Pedosphaera sp.]|nr:UDP-N-acetylglucosamine diphosphorylase [Pedosphaera sp.]
MFRPADLFDLTQTEHAALFDRCEFAWDALKRLKEYLEKFPNLGPTGFRKLLFALDMTGAPIIGPASRGAHRAWIGPKVLIGEGTVIEDGVMIKGPAIIGRNCEIRHGAYIRENVIVGDGCLVGNSCELKHAVLFNGCQVPHFNYVGDSILGHKAHLGAGVILSNVKSLAGNVTVEVEGRKCDTGLRKFGALLGDGAEIGCNSVLNPGSVIGRGAMIYPLTNWRGVLAANHIAKNRGALEIVPRRAEEK